MKQFILLLVTLFIIQRCILCQKFYFSLGKLLDSINSEQFRFTFLGAQLLLGVDLTLFIWGQIVLAAFLFFPSSTLVV